MKNLILVLFLTAFTLSVQAQSKVVVDEIILEADGVILSEEVYKEFNFILVQVPSYYDLELVMLSVKLVVNKYSDVSIYKNWAIGDNEIYSCVIDCVGNIIKINYNPAKKTLELIYK